MITRIWIRLAEAFVPAIIAVAILLAWQADRRDRAQLTAQLAAAQQIIAQASSSQKDRDAQLTQTLAQLRAQKQSNLTTAQLLQALPQALHLPAPIAVQSADAATDPNVGARFIVPPAATEPTNAPPATQPPSSKGNYPPSASSTNPTSSAKSTIDNPLPNSSSQNPAPNAVIPSSDLKPLYDFALDCQACQAKLSAAQADLADEKTKSAALTKERNAAIRAAKGGSILRRIARAAKWFIIGAAAGAVAAKATR